MGIFGWVRRSIKEAVLAGFRDAVETLQGAESPEGLLLEDRRAEGQEEATNGRPKSKSRV